MNLHTFLYTQNFSRSLVGLSCGWQMCFCCVWFNNAIFAWLYETENSPLPSQCNFAASSRFSNNMIIIPLNDFLGIWLSWWSLRKHCRGVDIKWEAQWSLSYKNPEVHDHKPEHLCAWSCRISDAIFSATSLNLIEKGYKSCAAAFQILACVQ